MIHNDGVTQFMNDNVVNHELWGFDDAPIDRDVFLFGTVPPLSFLTANVEFVVWQKQRLGEGLCSR